MAHENEVESFRCGERKTTSNRAYQDVAGQMQDHDRISRLYRDPHSAHLPRCDFYDSRTAGTLTEQSRQYQVRQGDTLSSIARDAHRDMYGRDPSQSELHRYTQRVARENGIKDPNKVHDGQKINIANDGSLRREYPHDARRGDDKTCPPASTRPGDSPSIPYRRPGEVARPNTNTNALIQPPGTESTGDNGGPSYVRKHTDEQVTKHFDGTSERTYRGEHDKDVSIWNRQNLGGTGNTEFTVRERHDNRGNLIERQTEYLNRTQSLKVPGKNGEEEVEARSVRTQLRHDGSFVTTILTKDGRNVYVRTNRDGTKERMQD